MEHVELDSAFTDLQVGMEEKIEILNATNLTAPGQVDAFPSLSAKQKTDNKISDAECRKKEILKGVKFLKEKVSGSQSITPAQIKFFNEQIEKKKSEVEAVKDLPFCPQKLPWRLLLL